jgi:arabinofuranan 3-O-arabinosyltransferase
MTHEVPRDLNTRAGADRGCPRLLGVFAAWRLQAYGYTLAASYAGIFIYLHWLRIWLVNRKGVPVYHDFTAQFVAGFLALRGEAASVYIPLEFSKAQEALVGTGQSLLSPWPYPPSYLLLLAPLATLPYGAAFLTWQAVTLLGCVTVVYLIVRRRPAIALVLASPFAACNVSFGQSGFLLASLVGSALLALERRPVLAGVFIGCLTYKPQFGILFPVALAAARQWRALVSAAITAAVLVVISAAAFGIGPWEVFPRGLLTLGSISLVVGPGQQVDLSPWGLFQTAYGLVRRLHGAADLAWLIQAVTTSGIAVSVWLVWRSRTRHALKAAMLSAGVLAATPYAFSYDLVAIAIPVAFLARDQLSCGLLKAEQTTLLALFAASLPIFATGGRAPLGGLIMLALLCLILRRVLRQGSDPTVVVDVGSGSRQASNPSWR